MALPIGPLKTKNKREGEGEDINASLTNQPTLKVIQFSTFFPGPLEFDKVARTQLMLKTCRLEQVMEATRSFQL